MGLRVGNMNLEGMMQREIEARHRSMRVASYLIQNVPAFKSGKLAICAYELDGLQTTQLADPAPNGWRSSESLIWYSATKIKIRSVCRSPASPGQQRTVVSERSCPTPGWQARYSADPVNSALTGAAFAQALLPGLSKGKTAGSSTDYKDNSLPRAT